jgi:hypothetical protein
VKAKRSVRNKVRPEVGRGNEKNFRFPFIFMRGGPTEDRNQSVFSYTFKCKN